MGSARSSLRRFGRGLRPKNLESNEILSAVVHPRLQLRNYHSDANETRYVLVFLFDYVRYA